MFSRFKFASQFELDHLKMLGSYPIMNENPAFISRC